jgi:geranylgeranyl diphosphate synthase type I
MHSAQGIGRLTAGPPRKPPAGPAGGKETGEPVATAGSGSALGVLEHAVGRADLPDSGPAEVRDVLVATGARDLVETKIARLAGECLRHLGEVALEPRAAVRLRRLLAGITGTRGQVSEPGGPPHAAALAAAGTEAGR